jgi:selenide,water dikinase
VLVGLEAPDDAGVYRLTPDLAIVQTVDFFTPIVDDPYAWGRIAAANALSDIYAMGGRPITALNLVGWPRSLGFDMLGRVTEGAGDACAEAGVTTIGGHSIDDPEPKFGLAVTGTVHPDRIVTIRGAAPPAALVLTKPLGTGIISSGIKEQKASPESARAATATMSELNQAASEAMLEVGVQAATDVTGFGLIGHLLQMLGDTLTAELDFESIPLLPGAIELARQGVFPAGSRRNIEAGAGAVQSDDLSESEEAVMFDAQTSGGLLMAVAPERLGALLETLRKRGVREGARIGTLRAGNGRVEITAR